MDGRYTRSTSSSKEDSSISIKLQQRTSVMDNHSESDTEHKPSGDGDCTSDNADNLPHAKETTDPSLIVSTQSSEEILERLEASVELPAFYSKQSQCPITLSPDHVNDVSKSSGDIEPSVISVHSLAASPIHYRCSSQLHSAPQEASVEFVGSQVKSSLDEKQGVFTVNSKVEDGSTSSPAVKVPSAVAETKPQRDRLWTTAISCIIASIPALLIGCTLGFPSVALFDLRALPPEFRLSTVLLDVFIVSNPTCRLLRMPASHDTLHTGYSTNRSSVWRPTSWLGGRQMGKEGCSDAGWPSLSGWLPDGGLCSLCSHPGRLHLCPAAGKVPHWCWLWMGNFSSLSKSRKYEVKCPSSAKG